MTSATDVTVLIRDRRFKRFRATVLKAALVTLAAQKQKGALTIVLTDDAEVKALNHQYRGKNKPTNVLSFENGANEGGIYQHGDVILSYDTLKAEAAAQKKKLSAHLTHLVMHGILHLLGHDHKVEADAECMEAIEIKLLTRMGIANPYKTA